MARVRVFRMMMVVMSISMIVPVVTVMMAMAGILQVQAALPGAEGITQVAVRDIRPRRRRSLPFDMMVMAFLNCAHLCLKPQNLSAIFAHCAVGWRNFANLFGDALGKSFQHLWVIV